jgi:ketosteroid isomerase-like protein
LVRLAALAAVLAPLAACAESSADTAAAREQIRAADLAFARATAERGAEGWVSFFAADGKMFRPGQVVSGPDSIRAHVTPWFADAAFSLTWEPTFAEVATSGDLGYTYGRYQSRGRDSMGNAVTGAGWYVTVWRRDEDGTWKVALDIGNPDGR